MLPTGLINIILEDSDSNDNLEMTISAMGEILNKRRRTSLHRGSVYGHAYIYGVIEFMGITSFFMAILEKILYILQNYFEGGFE